jgi:hypothetical protein
VKDGAPGRPYRYRTNCGESALTSMIASAKLSKLPDVDLILRSDK